MVTQKKISLKIGQIRWFYVGMNVGHEISKGDPFKRPGLIDSNDVGRGLIHILPITSQKPKVSDKLRYYLEDRSLYGLTKPSYVLLNQGRTISIKRLRRKANDNVKYPLVKEKNMQQLKQRLAIILKIPTVSCDAVG